MYLRNEVNEKNSIKGLSKILIYIVIFLNSISGLQVKNIAVNTYVNLFFFFIILLFFLCNKKDTFRIPMHESLIGYLIFGMCSSIISYFSTYLLEHKDIVGKFFLNSFAYLLIFVMLYNTNEKSNESFIETFIKGLIYTARIQVIWGGIQLLLLYIFGININEILFKDILKATNNVYWTSGFFSNNGFIIRITGLNYENAIFAIVVAIGMILEKNKIWKCILTGAVILSLSRTGWIMILAYWGKRVYELLFVKKISTNIKKLIKNYLVIIILILLLITTYMNNSVFKKQVNGIISRIKDKSSNSVSANRHILYYPYGINLYLFDTNIIQKFFGYGMRCSGIPFSESEEIMAKLGGHQNYTEAWAVECDIIGLLLGGGITTFLCYYFMTIKLLKNNNVFYNVVWIILLAGITYHFHSISYIIYIFIFATIDVYVKKQKQRLRGKDDNEI